MSEGVVKRKKKNISEIANAIELVETLCDYAPSPACVFLTEWLPKKDYFNLLFEENSSKIREFCRHRFRNFYEMFSFADIEAFAQSPKVAAFFLIPTMSPKESRIAAQIVCEEGHATILRALIECFKVDLSFKTYNFFGKAKTDDIRKILLEWRGVKDKLVYLHEDNLFSAFHTEDEDVVLMLLQRKDIDYFDHVSFSKLGKNCWINVARHIVTHSLDKLNNSRKAISRRTQIYSAACYHFDTEIMTKMYDLGVDNVYIYDTSKLLRHAIEHDKRAVLLLIFVHFDLQPYHIRSTFLDAYQQGRYVIMENYLVQFPELDLYNRLYDMNFSWRTIFSHAVKVKNMVVVEMLLQYPLRRDAICRGIRDCIENGDDESELIDRMMKKKNFSVSYNHHYLLFIAATSNSLHLVKKFMKHPTCECKGFDLVNVLKHTSLEIFKYILKHTTDIGFMNEYTMVRHLIEKKAKAENIRYLMRKYLKRTKCDGLFWTALKIKNCENIMVVLEEGNIDPTVENNKCLRLFLKNNETEYLKQLLEHPEMIEYFEKIKK